MVDNWPTSALAHLHKLALRSSGLKVCTIFTGLDIAMAVLRIIKDMILEVSGAALELHYMFACEWLPQKRSFMLENTDHLFHPHAFFSDAEALQADQALDYLSNQMQPIFKTELCIAGFECDSVSSQNNTRRSKGYTRCIAGGVGSTGRTWRHLVAFVDHHRPAMLVLENVRALGHHLLDNVQRHQSGTNLDQCVRAPAAQLPRSDLLIFAAGLTHCSSIPTTLFKQCMQPRAHMPTQPRSTSSWTWATW